MKHFKMSSCRGQRECGAHALSLFSGPAARCLARKRERWWVMWAKTCPTCCEYKTREIFVCPQVQLFANGTLRASVRRLCGVAADVFLCQLFIVDTVAVARGSYMLG